MDQNESPTPPPRENERAAGDARYAPTSAPLLPQPPDKHGSLWLGFGVFGGCYVAWFMGWLFAAAIFGFATTWGLNTWNTLWLVGVVVCCAALLAVTRKRTRWGVLLGALTALALVLLLVSICT